VRLTRHHYPKRSYVLRRESAPPRKPARAPQAGAPYPPACYTPVYVIIFAAQYQRRYFDLRGLTQRIPSQARFFVETKLFHRALS